ncbi:hypothetical protein DEU56DRAFT_956150, partial [Suillus clintonianus]|uniref:uncharacterized protein n=1 Tax=Suillus clintonianus TaxID=1904413 RepID=UPI001B866A3C
CLRIFLIGVGDHEKVTLQEAFSPYLIPSLHQDLREHIETALDVDMVQLVNEFSQDHPGQGSGDQEGRSDTHESLSDPTSKDASFTDAAVTNNLVSREDPGTNSAATEDPFADVDEDGSPDEFLDASGCAPSGFGLDGGLRKWNKMKFWNYVDAMLEQVRESARTESEGHAARYEDAYRKAMVEFLQLDLQEFPGRRKVPSLAKGPQPAWQETIQKKLL